MINQDYNTSVLQEIKRCIDNLDIPQLWKLALTDPSSVFNKISVRQLGVKRLEKLKAYLFALDTKRLNESHSFELLLLNCVEQELGAGLFAGTRR